MAFLDSLLCYAIIVFTIQTFVLVRQALFYQKYAKKSIKIDWISDSCAIFLSPLIEELLFRHLLKKYLGNIPYANTINSVLFGVIHMGNMYDKPITYIWGALIQSLLGTYCGMVLIRKPFWTGVLIHCLHNSFVVFTYYILYLLV